MRIVKCFEQIFIIKWSDTSLAEQPDGGPQDGFGESTKKVERKARAAEGGCRGVPGGEGWKAADRCVQCLVDGRGTIKVGRSDFSANLRGKLPIMRSCQAPLLEEPMTTMLARHSRAAL